MQVDGMTKEQVKVEMNKTLKVRAKGDPDIYVGYYDHLRLRGGNVFILKPIIRERNVVVMKDGQPVMDNDPRLKRPAPLKEKKLLLITAEQQFSERWMERVSNKAQPSKPEHFNKVGRGNAKNKLNIPGMTNKIGNRYDVDDEPESSDNFDAGPDESFANQSNDNTGDNVI